MENLRLKFADLERFTVGRGLEERRLYRRLEEIADLILNRATLQIAGEQFRINEIEFYVWSDKHADVFSHRHPLSKEFGQWYFHRTGPKLTNSPREGTRKGVDITLGNGEDHIAVLIRAIESKRGMIKGPSLTVDKIMRAHGKQKVKKLIEGRYDLYLREDHDQQARHMVATPRIGLKPKRHVSQRISEKFIAAPLRFTTRL